MSETLEQVRTRLAELVALPSVSCADPDLDTSNVAVVERIAEWLGEAGFALERQRVSEQPAKLNLIARLGRGGDGLVLSGHTDTVPYDARRWSSDPFTLSECDGRWYGLGSADMKCFFPIVLAALEGLEPQRLRRPLVVLATADEETSMAGGRALADAGEPLGRYGLIGEPTALRPVRRHKGIVVGRIVLTGRSGHSSDPALGASALDCMHDVMSDLKAWRAAAARRFADDGFDVPGPTLNFGRIRGGDTFNRICAECELLFDLRVVPGMAIADAVGEISDIVRGRAAAAGVEGGLELPMAPLQPLDTPARSGVVAALEELSGYAAGSVAFATEGPFLDALGCESVIFGPGDIATAHQPDEHVEIANVARMIDILRAAVERFCCHE